MDRRTFLRAGMGATTASSSILAGCAGLFDVQTGREPPVPDNRPQAVYFPSHVEGMNMVGMSGMRNMSGMDGMNKTNGSSKMRNMGGMSGTNDPSGMQMNSSKKMGGMNNSTSGQKAGNSRYMCALTYSYPHRFWTVTGQKKNKVTIQNDDSIHLMVSVWDGKTGAYVMDTNPSVTVSQGSDTVTTVTPWTMLSQNMGFHAGDNVALPGDGTYSITVDVPPTSARRVGGFEGEFDTQQSFDFTLKYSEDKLNEIMFKTLDQKAGNQGAVAPMKMDMMPLAHPPKKGELPGQMLKETTTGDAVFVVKALNSATRFGTDDGTYLAVSPRTPYNRYILPAMSLSARITRGRETVFDGALQATLDSKLNYHYGNTVESIESGDEIELAIDTPPQVARHEGYETAFFDMPSKTITV